MKILPSSYVKKREKNDNQHHALPENSGCFVARKQLDKLLGVFLLLIYYYHYFFKNTSFWFHWDYLNDRDNRENWDNQDNWDDQDDWDNLKNQEAMMTGMTRATGTTETTYPIYTC